MVTITTYLTFSGNCREAMTFYKNCLGGKLSFETIGESPLAKKIPEKMKQYILQAKLSKKGFVLLASDMVGDNGLIKGNAVSLMLNCSSVEEIKRYYALLSEEGKQTHPLKTGFWGAWFGDLTDKFGNHWLLHYQINKQ